MSVLKRSTLQTAFALAVLGASATRAADEPSKFVRLEGSVEAIWNKDEVCPIRFELPLGELFKSKQHTYRTGKVGAIRCEGVYIPSAVLKLQKGKAPTLKNIETTVQITVPQGNDKLLKARYWLMRGEEQLARAVQTLQADEGESNWGDPIRLVFKATDVDPAGADLWWRVEIEVQER